MPEQEAEAATRQAQPEDASLAATAANRRLRRKAWLGRSVVAAIIVFIWALAAVFFIVFHLPLVSVLWLYSLA